MNATGTKTVPLVSSGTSGPLGALHLPRLWTKLSLHEHGMLADGYDYCGAGFDQMTIDALGLERDDVIAFFKEKHPTYMEFEGYVVEKNSGTVPKEKIEAHNAAIRGYNHSDELGSTMRAATGNAHAHVKDAVSLNCIEDLAELHKQLEASH